MHQYIRSLAMQLECYILLNGCNEKYLREIIHACQIRMIQQKNIVTAIKNITTPPYTSRLIVESAGLRRSVWLCYIVYDSNSKSHDQLIH